MFKGQVIGSDPQTDLALVKIDDSKALPTARLGDSDQLDIGEWVVAIGNPFGLEQTVTAGIVSAKGRRDVNPGGRRGYFDFIQTDASINPGNSGGPLINSGGEVVGINSAVNAQGQGIGFAIPINMAKTIMPLLKQYHRVPRSWIGVAIRPASPADDGGALVAEVVPGSPADAAGVKAGEVIVEFDGKAIKRSTDLSWLVSIAGAGRTVPATVADQGGSRRTVNMTLAEKPER